MKQYKKYVIPYKSAFILGPIFMIVEVLGEIILPKLMSMIINYGCGQDVTVAAKGPAYIIGIGAAMIGTALLMMMGGVLGAYFAVKASVNFAGDLRRDVFAKVQKFSFANIEKFSTGSLVTRLTNDITNIQNVLSMGLRMLLRAPGMLIGGLIMAFLMNAKLALVFCVVIPVLIIALAFVMKTAFPRFDVMQTKIDGLNSRIQENITNQRVVKSFVRDDFEKETFDRANNELKDKTLRAMKVVILTMPIMTLAMNLTVMAVVWFGGQQILIGDMPVGNLTAFTTYVTQILMSLMMVSMIMIQGSRAMASSHRILEVLDTDIDLNDDNASEKDRLVTSGEIEFKNVCFRYYKKHKKNVLQNINFTAKPGEVVGIIGSTGSGKSSLVQLIPRLYDCDEGEVLVDGVNVKEYSLNHLRDGVAMVLQKNTLFSGDIYENLRWGNENADEKTIAQAAADAQADKFIRGFREGYNTQLGQGGSNVSGGQKQRLAIAGALAADTVTVMWGATLVARLLIAFVFPFKQPRKAMVVMGVSCTIFYILLVQARSQGAAIALLFAFAFAMAGMNPTAVASAGRMTSVTSMGIMLPVASSGAILMPWIIGIVAEKAGLAAGMASNIVPCVGLIIFTLLVARLPEE